MTTRAPRASSRPRNRGLFAKLAAALPTRGTGAPKTTRRLTAFLLPALTLTALALTATPALAAAPEAPTLTVEAPVHATEAVLHGILNPGLVGEPGTFEMGEYEFLYKAGATCTGGSVKPTPPGMSLGAGHEELPSETVTGLTAGTEYAVCLRVETPGGIATSTPAVTFTTATPPEAPETSTPAKSITAVSAELEGTLNPHATVKAAWYFAYSNPEGPSCTEGPASALEPEELVKAKKDKATVTGLEAHRNYRFCLVAENSAGETATGNEVSFLTKSLAPTVISESSSSIKATEARVEATVNAENEATECHFQYGTALVTEHEAECEQGNALTGAEQTVAVNLTGLEQGAAYKWRVVVKNPTGQKEGAEETFTTAITPEISGVQANPVTGTSATLQGVLNATKPGNPGTYEFLYNTTSAASGCEGETGSTTPQGTSTGTSPEPVSAPIAKLLPGTEYTFCLRASNAAGETITGEPVTFTTTAVGLEDSPSVTATEALVTAQIGTDNATTTYEVQYGITSVEEHTSPTPEASIPASSSPTPVQQALTGLEPGKIYHFRFQANNGHGPATGEERTFTTPAAPGSEPPETCPNKARRTEQPDAKDLPECRAYEIVSPAETNGNDATDPFLETGHRRAAENEAAITYASRGSFGEPKGATFESQLLSRREPEHGRWSTRSITAPYEHPVDGKSPVGYTGVFFTPELTEGLTTTAAAGLSSEAPEGLKELYRVGLTDGPGPYQLVSDLPPSEREYAKPYGTQQSVYPLGASSDLTHVVFATENNNGYGPLREWVNGAVVSVGVSNEGEIWGGATVGWAGELSGSPLPLEDGGADVWRAGSEDGTRVIVSHSGELYARVNVGVKVEREPEREQSNLNEQKECTEPAKACTVKLSAGKARYWGANTEDTKVFYVENGDLYEYALPNGSVTGQASTLTSGGEVQGVVQISEDGSYVYFIANGVLGDAGAHGAAPGNCGVNSLGVPNGTACNLYVSHVGGEPAFIATLSAKDGSDWQQGPGGDTAAVAPGATGGAHLAFTSKETLTAYDNRQAGPRQCAFAEGGKCSEVYLYDAETGALGCASCNPSGARPVGPATLAKGGWGFVGGASNYRPRDFLANGSLFFESDDALVPHSSGAVKNVYEYTDGHVYPISDPAGRYESVFLDATADGTDVFIATADQLLPQDTSDNVVVYDARAGGGFPAPAGTPPCTTAEACQPPASSAPRVYAPAGTATFSGPANAATSPPPAVVKPKPKPLTRAEKLAKALKHCRKDRAKKTRTSCEKQARKKYGAKATARKSATRATNDRRAGR
jgi:hypothetical protein